MEIISGVFAIVCLVIVVVGLPIGTMYVAQKYLGVKFIRPFRAGEGLVEIQRTKSYLQKQDKNILNEAMNRLEYKNYAKTHDNLAAEVRKIMKEREGNEKETFTNDHKNAKENIYTNIDDLETVKILSTLYQRYSPENKFLSSISFDIVLKIITTNGMFSLFQNEHKLLLKAFVNDKIKYEQLRTGELELFYKCLNLSSSKS